MTDLDPVAVHEAGHAVVNHRFGRALGVTGIRDDRGVSLYHPEKFTRWMVAGANPEDPPCLWPDEITGRYTRDIIALMAGDVAEEMLCAPVQGRVQDTISARAAELVPAAAAVAAGDTAPLSEADALELDFHLDAPGCSDVEEITKITALIHGDDIASAGAHLAYLRLQAVAVVLANERQIRRLALMLAGTRAMSGPAIASFLNRKENSEG